MDFQSWITNVEGLAGVYAFDILPDGSFSEIRLMAVNRQNEGILTRNPNAPAFYPGIPYRVYWSDINFEDYVYRCGSTNQPLYSYVNAHGFWLKGFYIPVTNMDTDPAEDGTKTVHVLYILEYADDIETDSMSQHSADVATAVTNISIKLHEVQDFEQAMAATAAEIKKICAANNCSIYTVDNTSQDCCFINAEGVQQKTLFDIAAEMGCSPFEVAMRWEKVLAMSDCLLLENLGVIEERDPQWYNSLIKHHVENIILYEIRCKQSLVGFIWVANFDTSKLMQLKKTLEPRFDGYIETSPWALAWDDENYYLNACDSGSGIMKHYRVDKMVHIDITDESREGKEQSREFNPADFEKKTFGMFAGRDASVTLQGENRLVGVIIDRFGTDIMIIPADAEHFRVTVPVTVSQQFFGWMTAIGKGLKIVRPDDVREQYLAYVREIMEGYDGGK